MKTIHSFLAVLLLSACSEAPATFMVLDIIGTDVVSPVDGTFPGDFGPTETLVDAVPCDPGAPCEVESDFGLCQGEWSCESKDSPFCSAPTPAEETCDGIDNDCDGIVDDIPCDDLSVCTTEDHCLEGICAGVAVSCDDDNSCTEDSCVTDQGCLNFVLVGVPCDDDDACTTDDFCDESLCHGADVLCDDQDPCTMDYCSSATGCVFEATDSPCDDEDPCTVGDLCNAGICTGTPVSCDCLTDEDCGELEDGDLCNGTLVCDVEQFPHKCAVAAGTVIECPQPEGIDADCLAAHCAPDTGDCTLVPAHESKACSDGDACTIGDICEAGECYSANPLNCNDGNPCTDDLCDVVQGCVHVDNAVACDDGNACTTDDTCADGLCGGGVATVCDDLNPCTDDSCNPASGCLFDTNSLPCDDADACTTDEMCIDGTCQNGKPVDCDDGNLCTTDACDPDGGCGHLPNSVPCDDGNACTDGDQCSDGSCQAGEAASCDDGNYCTDDDCDPEVGCLHGDNELPCDDNNACTMEDLCVAGECVGEGSLDCDDDNPCTNDVCLPLDGCQHENSEGSCSDGDGCTVDDHCLDGACVSGGPLDCDDQDICTDDLCNAGLCEHPPAEGSCDDQNLCTVDDTCVDGLCVGGLLDCDDGDVCTADACNPASGCTHSPNSNPCNDEDVCTTGDTCADGACAGTDALDCDDANICTSDTCDPATGCVHAFNAEPCNDSNACTGADLCFGGLCIGTELVICDDDNSCTDDSCAPLAGCLHANNEATCEDGDLCTTGDWCADGECVAGDPLVCDDDNLCTDDSCDPDAGCLFQPNNVACDDGNACTAEDTCTGGECLGGGPLDCNDHNPCTNDACDWQDGCFYTNNAEPCDDSTVCTQTDECKGGTCVGSNPLPCDDDNECTEDSCDPEAGCQSSPIVPCCGDGSIDGDEVCDDGADNGAVGLGLCSPTCQLTGRYELVMRMADSGQVLDGSWNNAYDRVVNQGQDCLVRFDGRVGRVEHIEYAFNILRFDFQPLHAYHNSWDTYAYVEMRNNERAGLGVTYRRGHGAYVWKKDFSQNSEATWLPAEVNLYCESETRFEKVSSFAANGSVSSGKPLVDLIKLVSEEGVECKVRYNSRISTAEHVEYADDLIYFDFLPLHASYNTWDSYAYVTVDANRAALASAYRRGHADTVFKLDRQQHQQYYAVNVPVDVFCRTWKPTIVATDSAAFSKGQFADAYKAVVTDGRDCRVGFDSRVAPLKYVEYTDDVLVFEFVNLKAPYDGYEAFARVVLSSDGSAARQSKYRRGNQTQVHKKSDDQSAPAYATLMPVTLFCDSEHAPAPAITVNSAGAILSGTWNNFFGGLTNTSTAYYCRIRADGRIMKPELMELAATNEPLYFDMAGLAALNGSWDAYAGVLLTKASQSAIYGSLRRGHAYYVWRKGRQQYAVSASISVTTEFLCE